MTNYQRKFGKPYENVEAYTWGMECIDSVESHIPFYNKYGSKARKGIIPGECMIQSLPDFDRSFVYSFTIRPNSTNFFFQDI